MKKKLYLLETDIMTSRDNLKFSDCQSEPKEVNPSESFSVGYVADVIQEYMKGRGDIHVSMSALNDWIGELEHQDSSRIQVGIIPFAFNYYNSCDPDDIAAKDGVYVSLIYGTEADVEKIATDIAENPEDEVYL